MGIDRRRNYDPTHVRTETHHITLDVVGVQAYIADQEANGWRVIQIVRDAKKSWLVVFEIDL